MKLLLLLLEIRSKKQRERESNMLYEVGKDKKVQKYVELLILLI